MNPQQLVMNFMQNNANPFWKNVFSLAQNGNQQELEKIANNLCSQRNWNYQEKFDSFKQNPNSFMNR